MGYYTLLYFYATTIYIAFTSGPLSPPTLKQQLLLLLLLTSAAVCFRVLSAKQAS
jgi:hypothetical protein